MAQLVFGCVMILPIKYNADGGLIHQQKQMQMNKYDIHEHIKIVDQDYKV